MFITPKYRKTVGALMMVAAFVAQWVLTELLTGKDDVSASTEELKQLQYEMLFQQTHDVDYLKEAMGAQAWEISFIMTSNELEASSATAKEDTAKLLQEALDSSPKSIEEYTAEKKRLRSKLGEIWSIDYVRGARSIRQVTDAVKYVGFALSLFGLLLVWTGDAFDKATWRLGRTRRSAQEEGADHD